MLFLFCEERVALRTYKIEGILLTGIRVLNAKEQSSISVKATFTGSGGGGGGGVAAKAKP